MKREIPMTTLNAKNNLGATIKIIGEYFVRYGLVLVLLWIGAMKFTAYEAKGVEPLVATSPLMSWLLKVFSLQGVSNLLGTTEITTGILIALRPLSSRAAAIGSFLATGTFLTTLTFLFSLPGWEQSLGGFPALSGSGGFLLKDLVLLGASIWSLGDSLSGGISNQSEIAE
jgi:reactive chlorine resistance protein C